MWCIVIEQSIILSLILLEVLITDCTIWNGKDDNLLAASSSRKLYVEELKKKLETNVTPKSMAILKKVTILPVFYFMGRNGGGGEVAIQKVRMDMITRQQKLGEVVADLELPIEG